MKVTKQETLYHEDHGATLKHKCGKRIVALSLFISFLFLGLSFFGLSSFFLFFYLGQCSINDDHHTSIYLQLNDYNSILEQNMTLYECLRRCTGEGNESRVTCMINYEWWLCHKYDVNYMIMQGNMTMMTRVMINGTVENHGNVSRNGYGNAIFGRYGGYFEEDIRRVYGTGESCAAQERKVYGGFMVPVKVAW